MMTSGSKPRYALLDGLRGVAALMVIWYHVFEAFATSPVDQNFNHGYLAVDFFFVLSGFVLGYAYDDRWQKGLTRGGFMLRRIIRLHPMVVAGVLMGVAAFIIQGCEKWDGTAVSGTAVALSLLLGLFMLPSLPGTLPEVRGNGEMFPLNGPSWSLFFEYIGSIAYALFLHRLSRKALRIYVAISAIALILAAVLNMSGAYHIGMGWTLADYGFFGGLFRLSFSFSVGLLLSREFKPVRIRGAFWICSIAMICIFSVPYIGSDISVFNGIYDSVCTILIFPAIVYLGASGCTTDRLSTGICEFFGAISYPVYIIQYPMMYLFYSWIWKNGYTFGEVWYVPVMIFLGAIVLAWLLLRYYDQPLRSYLTRKLIKR
ncbi:MAG: acyltransferase [Muribaculaceae bacterium]|nr:acyltransferase [Muribaculaceae bacterium]